MPLLWGMAGHHSKTGITSSAWRVGKGRPGNYRIFEYNSGLSILGLPLIHIAQGIDPQSGLPRVEKGIIAIRDFAVSCVSPGNIAFGVFSLGDLSFGLISLGCFAFGVVAAAGRLAAASFLAIGGAAFSLSFAIGGLGWVPHFIGGNGVDPDFL